MIYVHHFFGQFVRELKNLPKLLPSEKHRDLFVAFALAFVFMVLMSLITRPSHADNLLQSTLKSPMLGFLVALGIVRLARLYLRTPQGQPRREWVRSTAPKVAYFALYVLFTIAGSAALLKFDSAILQTLPFATRYGVIVPLGIPAFFAVLMLSLRLSQWLTRTGQSHTETRQFSLPVAADMERLAKPLTLHIQNSTRKALLGCAFSYALVFVICGVLLALKLGGGFQSSLVLSVMTLWSGVGALVTGTPTCPIGRISNARLRPRFGRAFGWNSVARVEEEREWSDLNEKGALSLVFRRSDGAKLWQFPLGDLDEDDKRELRRLFPDLN